MRIDHIPSYIYASAQLRSKTVAALGERMVEVDGKKTFFGEGGGSVEGGLHRYEVCTSRQSFSVLFKPEPTGGVAITGLYQEWGGRNFPTLQVTYPWCRPKRS